MNKAFLFCLIFGVSLLKLKGDPLIAFPEGDFVCQITVTPLGSENAPVPSPNLPKITPIKGWVRTLSSVTVTRSGTLQRTDFIWSDGYQNEAWTKLDSGLTLMEIGPDKTVQLIPGGSPLRVQLGLPLVDLNSKSLNWITPQSSTGNLSFSGQNAAHYQSVELIHDSIPPRKAIYQAWIDPKTLIPLALSDGSFLYRLKFSAPNPEKLVLPPKFEKEEKAVINARVPTGHL